MDPVHYNDERDEDEVKAAANRKVRRHGLCCVV